MKLTPGTTDFWEGAGGGRSSFREKEVGTDRMRDLKKEVIFGGVSQKDKKKV